MSSTRSLPPTGTSKTFPIEAAKYLCSFVPGLEPVPFFDLEAAGHVAVRNGDALIHRDNLRPVFRFVLVELLPVLFAEMRRRIGPHDDARESIVDAHSQEPSVLTTWPFSISFESSPRYQTFPAASCAYQSYVSSISSPSRYTRSRTTVAVTPLTIFVSPTETSTRDRSVPSSVSPAYWNVVPGTSGKMRLSIAAAHAARNVQDRRRRPARDRSCCCNLAPQKPQSERAPTMMNTSRASNLLAAMDIPCVAAEWNTPARRNVTRLSVRNRRGRAESGGARWRPRARGGHAAPHP